MINFTGINYDSSYFRSIISNIIGEGYVNKFLDLINKDYISISGSSILQTISKKKYNNSDLDIYIEINKLNFKEILDLLTFLHFNFNDDNCVELYKYNNDRFMYMYKNYTEYYQLEYIYNPSNLNNYINPNYNPNNNDPNNYSSTLKKYLKLLLKFINFDNKKIELIFISNDIEIILEKTFDYDIVKNYWKQNSIYCNNINAILNKTGRMTLKHFINRIALSKNYIEFNNFIKRYIKYTQRGYELYIYKTKITIYIIEYILNITRSKNYIYSYPLWIDSYYNNYQFLDNIKYEAIYIYLYKLSIDKGEYKLVIEKKSHIVKYILFAGIYQNYKFRKNLLSYSNYLLNNYLHPESVYVLYISNNWKDKNIYKTKKTNISYITLNNELKFLTLE
jgi:hypothetical protein